MKRQSFIDCAAIGLLGTVLAYFNRGEAAAEGFVLGAAAAAAYLSVLQRDVDQIGLGGNPFDMFNPLRIVRLLIPLVLVAAVGLTTALSLGFDEWMEQLTWVPGDNFVGFAPANAIYGAVVGYIVTLLPLQVRGVLMAAPEARDLVEALPGSLGVALRLQKEVPKDEDGEPVKPKEPPTQLPVLLVSGPRGCGKSSLVRRLRESDPRFSAPSWIATGDIGDGQSRRVVSQDEFDALSKTRSLAVNYRPYSGEGEQMSLGLEALSVLASAAENRACVLDVDPPTARLLLGYNWDRALEAVAAAEGKAVEVRLVTVWVSLPTLDGIMERNRANIKASSPSISESAVKKQLAPLRAQATTDIEWALTSGDFEFTVINEDQDTAAAELLKASRYCFGDPF